MSRIIVKELTAPGSLPLEISGSRTIKVDTLLTWLGDEVDVRKLLDVMDYFNDNIERHTHTYSGSVNGTWKTIVPDVEWSTGSYNVNVKVTDSDGNIAIYTGQTSFVNSYEQARIADVPLVLYHYGDDGIQLEFRLRLPDIIQPVTLDVKNNSGTLNITNLEFTVIKFH